MEGIIKERNGIQRLRKKQECITMDKNRSKHAYYIRIGWIQLGSLHYLSENRPFPERTLVYYDPQNLGEESEFNFR